ncbi:hypothetical protein HPB48_017800 [Haemaphysalis longicornis]|uniref:Uncharacterized protein n=1 Tax=Haemaphysalis longicornis TaxID=44386 RepID=A0A9J6FLD7_HAELO|nr:hypothetical protein HPB48_017800 [Haemaphysalis longicornis]
MVILLQKHFDLKSSELYSCVTNSGNNRSAALKGLTAGCNFGVVTTSATSTPPANGQTAARLERRGHRRTTKQPFKRAQQCCPSTSCFVGGSSRMPRAKTVSQSRQQPGLNGAPPIAEVNKAS